jgi:hypothetical protein
MKKKEKGFIRFLRTFSFPDAFFFCSSMRRSLLSIPIRGRLRLNERIDQMLIRAMFCQKFDHSGGQQLQPLDLKTDHRGQGENPRYKSLSVFRSRGYEAASNNWHGPNRNRMSPHDW